MLVMAGAIREGIALLDETMLAVTDGDLSPIVAGIVYCGVILACRTAQDVRRAQEWTDVLTDWCARQADLVAFTGRCLVHRAELMELRGAWSEALDEARRAGERALASGNRAAAAEALYRQGELHRLQGDAAAAEAAFRTASGYGREPQPGLACLRLQQGRPDLADAAIRRVLAATPELGLRAEILPAAVDILLAVGEVAAAREAAVELGALAGEDTDGRLGAMAAGARGAVALAGGDARDALVALRAALHVWQELEAPYEEARSRVLAGLACRALGDEDSAALELDAARRAFATLGARPDLARLGRLAGTGRRGGRGRPERARGRGPAPARRGRHEQGDRRRARAERADRGPPREQHLRQARRVVPHGGGGVRARAPDRLSLGPLHPSRARSEWVISPMRGGRHPA